MNKITKLKNFCAILLVLLISFSTFSQVTINNETFESGWGIWNDGGDDCYRGTPYVPNGNYAIRLRDNSGGDSSMTTNNINLTSYSSVDFTFDFQAESMENGEDFWVQYSSNGGSSWSTIADYNSNIEFTNSSKYTPTLTLNSGTYTFAVNSRFRIRCDASGNGDYVYIDNVHIQGYLSGQEIDVQGLGNSIPSGDVTPIVTDNTDYSNVNINTTSTHTFNVHNIGAGMLTMSHLGTGINITGSPFFTINTEPALSTVISTGSSVNFSIDFSPTAIGIYTATVSIDNDDSDENPYTFEIQGNGEAPLTEGPGGVTGDLEIWLKANDGAGSADNQLVSTWLDQAKSNDATVNLPGQEPTFRDNASYNVNYNPVVDFDTTYNLAPVDSDYSYDDTNGDFLQGSSGFYTQDIFAVILPDKTINSTFGNMDFFCGDEDLSTDAEDVTGFGYGRYSVRFTNEVFSYCVGPSSGSAPYLGYGVTDNNTGTNYNTVGILNARNHPTLSQQELYYNGNNVEITQNDLADFSNVNNSRYWIGRSEGYEAATDARIVEVISFSARKNDASLTDERNRIESYLALKYGITLGVNGTSKDYVASDGSVIWDVTGNSGYNYDIAGIGRDDDSDLNQKQSKSVNSSSIISMSLSNTELTNNLNTNTFSTSNEFIIWGNNGQNTSASATSITVSLGPATITTVTDVMNRIWKINETTGDDIGTVEVSVFESDLSGLPALTGNSTYVLLVADDPSFTTNLDTAFLDPFTFNDQPTREATFDFDGTKYFTIGIAYEEIQSRQLVFDGVNNFTLVGDNVDLAGSFTASAWVKPEGSNTLSSDKTVAAKNNGTEGYKLYLTNNNYVGFSVGTSAADIITSNTQLPDGIWHNIAVTYNGIEANIYIDGVLDNTKSMTSPTPNGSKLAIGAVYVDKLNILDYFKGGIDEIRIWDDALSVDQLHYVMNQELIKNGTVVNGTAVPNTITKNEIEIVNWNNLLAYYNMNTFIGTYLNDASGNGNRGSLTEPNNFDLEYQTSPLPYRSTSNGDWDTISTWVNGSQQYIPGSASIVDPNITVDWNIVETNHNITLDNSSLPAANNENRSVLGLEVLANELKVNSDGGLTVTHYLELNGSIDLEDESQLIQTNGSVLNVGSNGDLERDQQGTADTFTYNYWSSPVGTNNITSTNSTYESSFVVPGILSDGTTASSPAAITFLTSGYDGSSSPFGIADYWIWKFANLENGNYSLWQHMRSNGTIKAGEGYTMKGPGSGPITVNQNYVFNGKPNNGDISLSIDADNNYLVGNPYPSAISATTFINDNPDTNGTLYFWEHWGGGSHNIADYQGGYGLRNLSGGTPAPSHPDLVDQTGSGTRTPGEFIPVSQGFFVYCPGPASGTVNFENDQRVYEKDDASGDNSVFMRIGSNAATNSQYEDNRMKLRIGFDSFNGIHRQLLLTKDENATNDIDWGYDGNHRGTQIDDMHWVIEDEKFIIQGTNVVNSESVFPLGIKVRDNGNNSITIDQLEHVPDNLDIYVHDSELNIYHDIRQSDYQLFLTTGEYLDRFAIVFTNPDVLDTIDNELNNLLEVYYNNESKYIAIINPTLLELESLELFNILGQSIYLSNEIDTKDFSEIKIPNLSYGKYIINIETVKGRISKKVLVN